MRTFSRRKLVTHATAKPPIDSLLYARKIETCEASQNPLNRHTWSWKRHRTFMGCCKP
jgi:hypothetical protein